MRGTMKLPSGPNKSGSARADRAAMIWNTGFGPSGNWRQGGAGPKRAQQAGRPGKRHSECSRAGRSGLQPPEEPARRQEPSTHEKLMAAHLRAISRRPTAPGEETNTPNPAARESVRAGAPGIQAAKMPAGGLEEPGIFSHEARRGHESFYPPPWRHGGLNE
jgi:hypothetical protein